MAEAFAPAPEVLSYRPRLDWKPSRPNPRRWLHRYTVPRVDRTKDRSIASFLGDVLDQGAEGSCTGNSVVEGLYACSRIGGGSDPLLSRMEDYYLSRVREGSFPADVGASTDDSAYVVLQNGGLCAETVWPYDGRAAERPPLAVAGAPKYLNISQFQPIAASDWLDGALAAIDARQPVLCALAWYENYFAQYQSTGILSGMGGGLAGGHQILLTGWDASSSLLRCRNSWGATSPARTDLLPDSVAGDVWLPASFFTNGVVQELAALIPAGVTPPPTPPPPASILVSAGGPYIGAVGQPLTDLHLTATVSGGTPPYGYVWLIAGVVYGTANPLVNSALLKNIGTYPVVCTVTDTTGAKADSPATTLQVTAQPSPPTPPGPVYPVGVSTIESLRMSDGSTVTRQMSWP